VAFRGQEDAQRARIESLERELEAERAKNAAPPAAPNTAPSKWIAGVVALTALVAAAGAYAAMGSAGAGLAIALVLVAALVLNAVLIRSLLHVVPPGAILVISGRPRLGADGRQLGYRVIRGGRAFQIPLIERVDILDVRSFEVEDELSVFFRNGPQGNVRFTARMRICPDEPRLTNAIERFLGHEDNARDAARQCVGAALRNVAAQVDESQWREDRVAVRDIVCDELEADLERLGLELDTLQID